MRKAVATFVLAAFTLLFGALSTGAASASAVVSQQSTAGDQAVIAAASAPIPAYCAKGDMNDGLVNYDYQYNSEGWNYYNYSVPNTGEVGTTSCTDDPYVSYGYARGQDCVVNGVGLAIGSVAASGPVGALLVVVGIAWWGLGCSAEFSRS